MILGQRAKAGVVLEHTRTVASATSFQKAPHAATVGLQNGCVANRVAKPEQWVLKANCTCKQGSFLKDVKQLHQFIENLTKFEDQRQAQLFSNAARELSAYATFRIP